MAETLPPFDLMDLRVLLKETKMSTDPTARTTLLDVLSLYPVCDRLCSHLDISGLLLLKKISKSLSSNVEAHLKKRWDINRKLNRFVRDPKGLRSQMSRLEAVISGSFVLQFLDGVTWDESDLDIYAMNGPNANEMGHYIHEKEGYRLEKQELAHNQIYPENDILKTATYKRELNGIETKIQLIITISIPLQAILSGYYTTAVVNIITWNTVYSMFPRPTFLTRKTYMLQDGGDANVYSTHIEKYSDRGWEFAYEMQDGDGETYVCRNRYVGDSKTWKLPLDVTDIEVSSIPDFVIEACEFEMEKYPRHTLPLHKQYWGLRAVVLRRSIFKYAYTCCYDDRFWKFVEQRMNELAWVELEKLSVEDRPDWYTRQPPPINGLDLYDANIVKLPTWTYYDHLIPVWLEKWAVLQTALSAAGEPTRETNLLAFQIKISL